MDKPDYAGGTWGMQVVDLDTGNVVYARNAGDRFMTGSVAKVFSVTAALDTLGPDHTFKTPVVTTGTLDGPTLRGDLVLRAAGDLTFGDRRKADGTLDVPIFDHYDANALPGLATLSTGNPLLGLDELAQEVAAAGIHDVSGNVLIDDRLWDPVTLDGVPITPISVNDNLVDFLVRPGAAAGAPATFSWQPMTAAYAPSIEVTTGAPDSPIDLTVTPGAGGKLVLAGSVPLGHDPIVHTYQVPDPGTWARTLFIEALRRHGVTVSADPLAANDPSALPTRATLDAAKVVASFDSVPFSETARLINKVSHNLGANQLPLILAANAGKRTLADGLVIEQAAVAKGGVAADQITLTDGQGLPGNTVSPEGITTYLRSLTSTPTFKTFYDSTPILGVDGSLASVLPAGDPAIGHAHAKTGTLVSAEGDKLLLETKALAGYLDAASGKRYAFGIFVNNVPISGVNAVLTANSDIGAIASQLYRML
ncbi:D-alanyl-D-alanine carboxypeptidase/D-alanyl-D-alanine-endopeptidase [Sinomonas cyclohexanicum]|uniref:D-alanyl-D-alanine carboxypeptidase/D-alanyl-D-alanine-endopeptidase n=2 Tax=Sinomonas cyclohexanicum TaxID=322009 RepID=A0ABN6FGP6_SINCY|nr:D-alanyl-D-alanine carboxypeptidase/D-alanyl-D-alanine-endopeptidase [Corynebacterium cyclohexanicum]